MDLKSQQIHEDPSAFGTTTIGVAHLLQDTGVNTPLTSFSNSSSTFFLRLYGTGRAFKNTGVAPSLRLSRPLMLANLLIAFRTMFGYFFNRESILCCFHSSPESLTVNFLTSCQSIGILLSQFLPVPASSCPTVVALHPP